MCLIAGYALGAPLLTAVSGRFSRKRLLPAMVAIFTIGNFASVAAPGYGWLMAARVRSELRAFARPAVLLTLAVGAFGFAGVFALTRTSLPRRPPWPVSVTPHRVRPVRPWP